MMAIKPCAKILMFACLLRPFAPDSWAQGYPEKVVRYVLPGSAGSGADLLGRMVAGGLTQVLGQQVIVENRTGAGGNIGAEIAAKAPADGYTLLQISVTHTVNVTLYRKLAYDVVRDFSPVTHLATSPAIVIVHPALPVKSLADLVRLAKAKPGALNYASGGTGTPTFLGAELFKSMAAVNMVHVPYRGGGESLTAVISGEAPVFFAPIATTLQHVQQGRLRALAVTSGKRISLLPGLPTVAESGYPGYESGNWYGLLAPAKTPKDTIAIIRNAAVNALNKPDMGKRLLDLGYIVVGDQPEEFAAFIKSEISAMGKIVRDLGLTAE